MQRRAPPWRDWINEQRITGKGSRSWENPCDDFYDENFGFDEFQYIFSLFSVKDLLRISRVYLWEKKRMGLCRSDFTTYLWWTIGRIYPRRFKKRRSCPCLALNIDIVIFIATISAAPINKYEYYNTNCKTLLCETMWTMLNATYPLMY